VKRYIEEKQGIMKHDINKFSFAQLTSNNNGKTSGSGTMGVLITTIGTLCFILGCIDKVFINQDTDVITQSIVFVGIGTALLAHRNHIRRSEEVIVSQIDSAVNDQITDAVTQSNNVSTPVALTTPIADTTPPVQQNATPEAKICATCGNPTCGCNVLNS
jgi:hypothetical protein